MLRVSTFIDRFFCDVVSRCLVDDLYAMFTQKDTSHPLFLAMVAIGLLMNPFINKVLSVIFCLFSKDYHFKMPTSSP